MDNFVTIKTFTYPTELAVLRSRLEAEGIECLVLDELTAQVNPFYSNAIGGVKLQVRESDVPKAIQILKEGGYIKEQDLQSSNGLSKLERSTARLPLLKSLRPELRLMIIVAVGILVLAGTVYFATLPSTTERLTKRSWCIDRVDYNGETFATNTVRLFQITGMGICRESMDIEADGRIILPGFNSRAVWGWWSLKDDSLQISQADTFDFVYNGLYEIDFSRGRLILKSKQTTLYCHPQNIQVHMPF